MADIVYFLDTLMNVLANGVEATMIYEIQNPKDDNVFKKSSPSVVQVKFIAKNKPNSDVLKSAPVKLSTKQTKLIRERAVDFVNNAPAQEVLKRLINFVTQLIENHAYGHMLKERDRILEYLYKQAEIEKLKEREEKNEDEEDLYLTLKHSTFNIIRFIRRVRNVIALKNDIKRAWIRYKTMRSLMGLSSIKKSLTDIESFSKEVRLASDFIIDTNKSILEHGLIELLLKPAVSIATKVYDIVYEKVLKQIYRLIKKMVKKAIKSIAKMAAGTVLEPITGGLSSALVIDSVADFAIMATETYLSFKNIQRSIENIGSEAASLSKNLKEMSKSYTQMISERLKGDVSLGDDFISGTRELFGVYDYRTNVLDAGFNSIDSFLLDVDKDGKITGFKDEKELPVNNLFFRMTLVFRKLVEDIKNRIDTQVDVIIKKLRDSITSNVKLKYKIDINSIDIKPKIKNAVSIKRIKKVVSSYEDFKNKGEKATLRTDYISTKNLSDEIVIGDKSINLLKIINLEALKPENVKQGVLILRNTERPFYEMNALITNRASLEEKRMNTIYNYCTTLSEMLTVI